MRLKRVLSYLLICSMVLGLLPFGMSAQADGGNGPFTVVWQDELGNELAKKTVSKGEAPVYDGPLPKKDGDLGHRYLFMGWRDAKNTGAPVYYSSFPKAEQNVTYRAVFRQLTRQYIVSFVNDDGTPISDKAYDFRTNKEDIELPPDPVKPADAQWQYTFDGWEPEVAQVIGNAVYRAAYRKTPRVYTVTWVIDGVEETAMAAVGETPSHADPVKAADAQYAYTFAGWSPNVVSVTGDVTYTALFDKTPVKYPIKWISGGTELGVGEAAYGTTPVYDGALPTAEGRTFLGWSTDPAAVAPELLVVTGPAEYHAVFTDAVGHLIAFQDDAGNVLSRQVVADGTKPTPPGMPVKAPTAEHRYEFKSWQPSIVPAGGDAVYTATFYENAAEYPVVWLMDDGSHIADMTVACGVTPEAPAAPRKQADERYTYEFTGWAPAVVPVAGAARYTAVYTKAPRQYMVKWMNGGTELDSKTGVLYDSVPKYTGVKQPEKSETPENEYVFTGWLRHNDLRDGVITMTARFAPVAKEYPIVFLNDGGQVINVLRVKHGTTPVPPAAVKEADAQYEYAFDKWTPELAAVTGSAVYAAVYTKTPRKYTVTFVDYNNATLKAPVKYGYDTMPVPPANPTRASTGQYAYTFIGWDPAVGPVTKDQVYKAKYEQQTQNHLITWTLDDGTVIDTTSVPYSETPSHVAPTKAPTEQYTYLFTGWLDETDQEPSPVTGAKTYHAAFAPVPRKYTIRWMDGDKLLWEEESAYGTIPVYRGESLKPTAEAKKDARFTYDWKGDDVDPEISKNAWSPAVAPVAGDTTYRAVFVPSPRAYTVYFTDDEGTKLYTDVTAEYDSVPVYRGSVDTGGNPAKEPTEGYTYVFDSWDKPLENERVTEDGMTYVARFDKTERVYEVTWVDGDGLAKQWLPAVPYSETVAFDADPQSSKLYTSAAPTKSRTAELIYVFTHWEKAVDAAAGKITYTAIFDGRQSCRITWLNEDGSLIDTTDVAYGEMPTHADPVKEPTVDRVFPFTGWTPALVPATGEAVYTASFGNDSRTYTVTWNDAEGNPIKVEPVEYGKNGNPPDDPAKAADAQYTYTFAGWDPVPGPITGDTVYTPQYTKTLRKYTITWVNYDDTVLETDTEVEYGAEPVYNGTVPAKDLGDGTLWFFVGWTPDVASVTGDQTYKASFTDDLSGYVIITWKNGADDANPDTTYVKKNTMPTHADPVKEPTAQYEYQFTGWTPVIVLATENATYTANYTEVLRKYTVTWKNEDGMVLETDTDVPYGTTPTYDAATPTKAADASYTYTFKAWTPAVAAVAGDAVYQATYSASSKSSGGGGGGGSSSSTVTITWVVDGVKTTTSVRKGDTPVYPNGTPSKQNATFQGWTPTVVPATADATYTAVFSSSGRSRSSPSSSGVSSWLETGEHIIYIRGYPDKSVQPNGNIARSETAMILYRLLLNKNVTITKSFSDVPADEWYTEAVLTLASLGIITGYPDGTFRPQESIARSEFTAMCVRFAKVQESTYFFSDVDEEYWAYREIMTAAHYGWIDGYTDGTFRPNNKIVRCEAAAVVNRMLGRSADHSYVDAHESQLVQFTDLLKEWYYYEMVEATNGHSYESVNSAEVWKSLRND